ARESQRDGKGTPKCEATVLPTCPGQSAICRGAQRPCRISLEKRQGGTGRRTLAGSATARAEEWGSGQLVGRRLPQHRPRPRSGGAVSFGGSLRRWQSRLSFRPRERRIYLPQRFYSGLEKRCCGIIVTRPVSISRSQPTRSDRLGICPSLCRNVLWAAQPRLGRGPTCLAALSRAFYEPQLRLLATRAGEPQAAQEN